MNPVLVRWKDAHFAAEELTVEEAAKLAPVITHSVGYPVQGDGCLVLFMSAWPDNPGRLSEWLVIPLGMVVEVRELG